MKSTIARLSLILALSAILLAMVSAPLAAGPAAAATTRIPIENWFIACEEVKIERKWVGDGILHVRGRELNAVVVSTENYHAGPAKNWANANIVLATGYGTFHGMLEMRPEAYPGGWWEGHFSIQGPPGDQDGVARLKRYGSLAGYSTKTRVRHMPGPALDALFPDVCGVNVEPLGGSHAVGFVMIPGGE
jgi:hypothetical protein